MTTIDTLAADFLAQKRIAIAGVSATRENAANLIYRTLKQRGYTVYGINPHGNVFQGARCYPSVASLPEKPRRNLRRRPARALRERRAPGASRRSSGLGAFRGLGRVHEHMTIGQSHHYGGF